jgi:hypothetical protein
MATVEETAAIYEGVLHELARVESLHVLTLADARFSTEVQARAPSLHRRVDALYARLRPVVEQHHFAWADIEQALGAAPDRSIYYTPDGVHTTPAFHATVFEVVRRELAHLIRVAGE